MPATVNRPLRENRQRPIRVLELRCADGAGGGPEKTILHGAAQADPDRFAVTLCYIRDHRDTAFDIDRRAARLGLDYFEIRQRHGLDPAVWTELRRIVRARGIDIVHAHDYKTDLLALLLTRVESVIPLATAHGWTGHRWQERLLYYPADRRLLARFPRVIAVSGEIRDQLLAAGAKPERVTTILNGIDHQIFRRNPAACGSARDRFGLAETQVAIGAMGRLEPQKRLDSLLEAMALLRPRRPELCLLIAGEGSDRPMLETMINRLGLAASCRLLGHCPDVVGFHHAIDILVQSSDYEGTPNVVLEAMALETPVVATAVGGTAELMTDRLHGLLVPPRDPERLAEAIDRVLSDSEATIRRVAAARTRIEHELSFAARMAAVEGIYDDLLRNRKPGGRRA